jgi:hypothetical protein
MKLRRGQLRPRPLNPEPYNRPVRPRGKRTLTATCSHYGVTLGQAHTSHDDALAAARLAFVLAQVLCPGIYQEGFHITIRGLRIAEDAPAVSTVTTLSRKVGPEPGDVAVVGS